jgi:hypothetical protein
MPNTTDQRRIDGDSVCSGSCKLNGPRQCVLCFEEQPGHELAGRQDVVDECDRLSGEREELVTATGTNSGGRRRRRPSRCALHRRTSRREPGSADCAGCGIGLDRELS